MLTTTLFSCSKKGDNAILVCGVSNPVEDLVWLSAEINIRTRDAGENDKFYYISQAVFEDRIVFLYQNCDPKANTVIPVYDCAGESLGFVGKEHTLDQFLNLKIIYSPDDFQCSTD